MDLTSGTLVIVAKFKDGVIMASDSRGMLGTSQTDGLRKIYLICGGRVAVANVGHGGVFDQLQRALQKQPDIDKVSSVCDLVDILRDLLLKICKAHLENKAVEPDEFTFEAVVCGLDKLDSGDPVAYRILHTGWTEILPIDGDASYYVTGHARAYAYSLMKLLYGTDVDEEHMIELLSYVLYQTGLTDTSVGGSPQVVTIRPSNMPQELSSKSTGDVVRRVASLSSILNQILSGVIYKEKELYKTIGNFLLEDLGGIVKDNRKFIITLEHSGKYGPDLIVGEENSRYEAKNDSDIAKDLFVVEGESDVVSTGHVTIPEPLKEAGIPKDPKILWNLVKKESAEGTTTGLRVDGRDIMPSAKIDFTNSKNHSQGISYKIEAHYAVLPQQVVTVEQASRCLFTNHDYIVKKFAGYGTNVEVVVNKPKDLMVSLRWFVTAKGKRPGSVVVEKPESDEKHYSEKVKGAFVPGNGFIVMWWPRHKKKSSVRAE